MTLNVSFGLFSVSFLEPVFSRFLDYNEARKEIVILKIMI